MYTSAVVPRPVHLCTDSLSTHIGTVLLAQYYVSSVVWCAGALHTTLLLLARSHSRESCLTLHDTLIIFSKLLAHLHSRNIKCELVPTYNLQTMASLPHYKIFTNLFILLLYCDRLLLNYTHY
jgi:hypothetical protein